LSSALSLDNCDVGIEFLLVSAVCGGDTALCHVSAVDVVVRAHFYKYFHPKEALVSNGVLNR